MAVRKAYSIGFTRRRAPDFFGTIKEAGVKRLIDVRLNNSSQLAGFTKREDLPYFLEHLCGVEYIHEPLLAPTKDMLDAYRKQGNPWQWYEKAFLGLMDERHIHERLPAGLFDVPAVLLCSEYAADCCHRRLVLEYLQNKWGEFEIVHL